LTVADVPLLGDGPSDSEERRGTMPKKLKLLCELKPGEPGTEEFVKRFGDALVCVRHWYNPDTDTELTTAEVVDSEWAWQPRRHRTKLLEPRSPLRKN